MHIEIRPRAPVDRLIGSSVSLLSICLSLQGTLQKFVDDVFVAILNTKRPPPIAVRYFFDFLDDMAEKHGIDDPETVHIWKTNRYSRPKTSYPYGKLSGLATRKYVLGPCSH